MLIYGEETAANIVRATRTVANDVLKHGGIPPTIALTRMGDRPDDVAYQKTILRTAAKAGVRVFAQMIPEDTEQAALLNTIRSVDIDDHAHGIMVFRPLPAHIDEGMVRNVVSPHKDVDGITDASMAWLYAQASGAAPAVDARFAPCTAEAAVRLIESERGSVRGLKAVVVGRSLVIGKPAALLLLARDATVTVAHSKTADLASVTREADIVVVCAGLAGGRRDARLGAEYFTAGQTIIDCGINADADGLYGDVDTDAADALGAAVTPVPGGLGAVTTAVLMDHVVRAASVATLLESPVAELKC
jgi:methylenetetrahydrofolate dehydrogenase (NADP+)/methenyltetrahydrofolate cyclohydrolase